MLNDPPTIDDMKSTGSLIRQFFAGMFLLSVLAFVSDGCTNLNDNTNTGGGNPGPNEVWIQGMAFNPGTINVTAGATVTWTNKDGIAHTVTSNTSLFDSGSIASGGTFSHTFATAGTYAYHCAFHAGMTGTVKAN